MSKQYPAVQPKMTGKYYLDDVQEMSLPEIHQALRNGQISLDVFCDYINDCIYLGQLAERNNAPVGREGE